MSGPSLADRHPRRLNPFAFPSHTTLRFVLLIAVVLAASLLMYASDSPMTPPPNPAYEQCQQEMWRSSRETLGALKGTLSHQDAIEVLKEVSRCLEPYMRGKMLSVRIGMAALLGLAGIIYCAYPVWKIWRGALQPLQRALDAPEEVVAYLDDLCREIGLVRPPEFLSNPINPAINGLAFGRLGRYYVALPGGLIERFDTDRPAFRAIMLHELAHLQNRDINKTYFTRAIWWAFVVAVLLPSAVKKLWFPDDNIVDLVQLTGFACVLTVLVYLSRNAVFRARELYADVRASAWDGPTGALGRIFEVLPHARGKDRWAMFRVHPSPRERRQTIEDTSRLFRLRWWEAVGTGIAATMSVVPLTLFLGYLGVNAFTRVSGDMWEHNAPIALLLLTIGPSLLVISLAVAAVGGGAWQAMFAALLRGDTPPAAGRLACGLGIGFLLGGLLFWAPGFGALMTTAFWKEVQPSPPSVVVLAGFNGLWFGLLLTSLILFFKWVMAGTSAWLEPTLYSQSPRLAYYIGLLLASGLFSVWFGMLFMSGVASNFFLLWGSNTSTNEIGTGFAIVLLGAMINPVTLLGLMSLWAFPLAAWFWRQTGVSVPEPNWLFLDPSPHPWTWMRQAPLRPGLALTLGVAGGGVFWGLLPLIRAELLPEAARLGEALHEAAVRQFGSESDFIPSIIRDLVLTGTLVAPAAAIQACVAALVAGLVKRLGALHGLFAAFVAGGVMTLGIRWLLVDVSSELQFWLVWIPLVGNGGTLMALVAGLGASAVGRWLRDAGKRGRQG